MIQSWIMTSIISALNILLIFSLLYVYVKNLIRVKSGFLIGLILFAGMFLIQNIILFYYSITMMPLYAESINSFMILFSAFQTVAFIILNWLTWK